MSWLAGCERCEARLTAALRGAAGAEAGGRPASWDDFLGMHSFDVVAWTTAAQRLRPGRRTVMGDNVVE